MHPPPKSATEPCEIILVKLKPFLNETAFYAKLAGRFLGPKAKATQSIASKFDTNALLEDGVEDTRLEAKDTKKNPRPRTQKKIRGQGQGQPFRGQTVSKPRTGMLEAKVQGHSRKCFQKKKRDFQKSFSGNLQLLGVARIFGWGAKTTNHMQWRHQKFSKEKLSWDKDIVRWKIWNRCLSALNHDFAKRKGSN